MGTRIFTSTVTIMKHITKVATIFLSVYACLAQAQQTESTNVLIAPGMRVVSVSEEQGEFGDFKVGQYVDVFLFESVSGSQTSSLICSKVRVMQVCDIHHPCGCPIPTRKPRVISIEVTPQQALSLTIATTMRRRLRIVATKH